MSDKKVEINRSTQKQLLGLTDGGKVVLTCKSCKTDLIELWITYGNDKLIADGGDPITTKAQAICKICDNKSPVKEVDGIFHVGIASEDLFMEHSDTDTGIVTFIVDRRKQ